MRALITWPTTQGCNFHSPLSKTRPCRTPAALEPFRLEIFSKIESFPLGSTTSVFHLFKNIPLLWMRLLSASATTHVRELRPCPNPALMVKPSPAGSGYSRWTRLILKREATCDKYGSGTTDGIFFFPSNPLISSHMSIWWGAHRKRFERGGKSRAAKASYWGWWMAGKNCSQSQYQC